MANWYVSYPLWQVVPAWPGAGQAVSVGTFVRQTGTPTAGNERVFRCTTGGVTGSTEPTWNLNKGNNTTDNTVIWTEVTGNELYQTSGIWSAPHASISTCSQGQWAANGDTIFVDKNHTRTYTTSTTLSGGNSTAPKRLFSVNVSGAIPPGSNDLVKGAAEAVTGTVSFSIQDWWSEINGFVFTAGSGATSSGGINIASGGGTYQRIRNCTLALGNTTSGTITIGPNNGSKAVLDNTQVSFNSTSAILMLNTEVTWRDTSSFLASGSVLPTILLRYNNNTSSNLTFENVDFSSYTAGTLVGVNQGGVSARFLDCKIASGITISSAPSGSVIATVSLVNCDSGGLIGRYEQYTSAGSQITETTLVRTNGALYGSLSYSWRIATNTYMDNYVSPSLAIWSSTTGSQTFTLEGIWNSASLPTQDDLFIDLRYPGTSGSTLGSRGTGSKSNSLAAAVSLPASTAAWDSLVTARSSSKSYTVGQFFKITSNPGRVFFCITAGQTASAEPAGYTSAVDGGTITDGQATFRAGVRFKIQAAFNQAIPGIVSAQIRVLRNSAVFYIDPLQTIG
jgi:hypothetical protein